MTNIGNFALEDCSSLTSIEVNGENTCYHVNGNCLIETASNTLIRGCNLADIIIPNSVTSIDSRAFKGCNNLTSITIPESVTTIDVGTFEGCTSLTSITIPNSVTSIDKNAFSGCSGLEAVTIPGSVISIGDGAFSSCTALAEVTLQGKTLPECNTKAFNNISASATLYCKAALVETCKVTEPWKNFKNIVVKSFSITISDAGIATGCFDDDLNFSEVTGVKAYIASGFNPETGKVLMTNVTEVPAGTGFLVKGEEGTYKIPAAATKYVYVNMLVGTLEETTVAKTTEDNSYTNYVLANDATNGVGFYLADNNTVSANRAYLQIPTSAVATGGASEAKTIISLSFDDDTTTGITQIGEQSDDASGNAVIYNLNGQRKQSLTKGLNIVNGKKIFVK